MGNISEILNLLDKNKYSGEQVAANYQMLAEKWGEMQILSDTNSGLTIKYIDISKAIKNGASITYLICTIIFAVTAIATGKVLFPQLSKMYDGTNEQIVDLATLQMQETIKEVKETKTKKEWF